MDMTISVPPHLLKVYQDEGSTVSLTGNNLSVWGYSPAYGVKVFSGMERCSTPRYFIMISGKASLVVGEGDAGVDEVYTIKMEKGMIYHIPPKVWHHVILRKNARLAVIENNLQGTSEKIQLEKHVIRACRRDFRLHLRSKAKRSMITGAAKKGKEEKKLSSAEKKHLKSIQQLTLWPEFQ